MTIQSDNTKGRSLADNFWAQLGLLMAPLGGGLGRWSTRSVPLESRLGYWMHTSTTLRAC